MPCDAPLHSSAIASGSIGIAAPYQTRAAGHD